MLALLHKKLLDLSGFLPESPVMVAKVMFPLKACQGLIEGNCLK